MGKSSEKSSRKVAPASSELVAGLRELISKTNELLKICNSVSRNSDKLDVATLASDLPLHTPAESPLLITRERIAVRYDVSVRTIDNWMVGRIKKRTTKEPTEFPVRVTGEPTNITIYKEAHNGKPRFMVSYYDAACQRHRRRCAACAQGAASNGSHSQRAQRRRLETVPERMNERESERQSSLSSTENN
jgi:hypothetical protein